MKSLTLKKIISGGQTGADRAALDAASYCGFPTGGWAPKGWMTQTYDGHQTPDRSLELFGLKEYPQPGYPVRTKANVQDSDGTVWCGFKGSPGGKLTCNTARRMKKPLIINPTAQELLEWVMVHEVKVLNVAGNRLSEVNPDIYRDVFRMMVDFLKMSRGSEPFVTLLAWPNRENYVSVSEKGVHQAIAREQKWLANELGDPISGSRALSSIIGSLNSQLADVLEEFESETWGYPVVWPDE